MHNFQHGKSSPKRGVPTNLYNFQKVPKENYHPMGENSPSLVILFVKRKQGQSLESRLLVILHSECSHDGVF
jgi:hypothetical protein